MKVPLEVNNYYIGYGDAIEGRTSQSAEQTYREGYAQGSMSKAEADLQQAAQNISFEGY